MAVDERVVVVAVGAEGQPARGEVELVLGGVRVEAGRAQGEVAALQLVLVPDALAEDAHPQAPLGQVPPGALQGGAQLQRIGHADVGDDGRADLLEGHVGVGAGPLGDRRGQERADVRGGGAGPGQRLPAGRRTLALVHVAAGAHVPFVAAGLPVLKALGVRGDGGDLRRGQAVLQGHGGHFGERGVLELVQPGGEDVVDQLGGLLGGAVEEGLQDQYPVAQLALVLDLPLVGEEVVAQVHGVGERLHEHPERPGPGDGGGHLGGRVLHEPGRPGGAADLAAHLDVLDGVGDAPLVDVGQLPHRLVQQVLGGDGEAAAPVGRHRGDGAGPQVGEARLDRVLRLGHPGGVVERHEQGEPVQVGLAGEAVLAAFELLQEVVVEEEDPHVPVGDEGERRPVAVGVGVGAEQAVVVGVEVGLLPDPGALQHAHLARPRRRVGAGLVEMRVEPRGMRQVEVRELEGLLRHGRALPTALRRHPSGRT